MENLNYYEIEITDLSLSFNIISYFLNKSLSSTIEILENKDKLIEKENFNKYEINFEMIRFLFFLTILTKAYLNNGNTFILLPGISNKKVVFKISRFSKINSHFESLLILLSDYDKNSVNDIDDNYVVNNTDKMSEEFIFSFTFGNLNDIKNMISNINKISLKNFKRFIFEEVNSKDIKSYYSFYSENNDNVIQNPPLFVYEDEKKNLF